MQNLIKAELYKLRRTKQLKKILGITLLALSLGLFLHIVKPEGDETLSLIINYINDRGYGFSVNDFENIRNSNFSTPPGIVAQDFLFSAIGFTPIIYMLIVYFIGNIISDEYKDKTIMHKINYGYSRYEIYISKLITALIGTTIIALFPIAVNTIIGGFMYEFSNFDMVKILKFLITYMLILYASTSFYELIANTIKKIKSELMGLGALILFLPAFLSENNVLFLTKYIPYGGLLDICGRYPTNQTMISLGISSIVIIFITTILGCMIMKKQDISKERNG